MRRRLQLLFAVMVMTTAVAAGQTPIQYVYDELGRLVAVIQTNGDAATYHYDPVGNLTGITRTTVGSVAIFDFTPNGAAIGSTVTLFGIGFSSTPSLNIVTINGTSATVTSASGTSLVVTVPVGATSGTLAVTTPSGSASAATPFLVGGPSIPSISGFSPTIGVVGTAITVTGSGFNSAVANNKVSVNLTYGAPTSASSTQLVANVPTGGTSGRVTISTPHGTAASTADFFVPPAPFVASDVLVADRMTIGSDKLITIGAASKIGLLVFDMTAGQRVSLRISGVTATLSTISVRSPYGQIVGSATVTTSGGFIEPFRAAVAGTFTVVVDPSSTHTGSFTLHAYDMPADLSGAIVPGGSGVGYTFTAPGQNGRWTFSGTAGQRISMRVTNHTVPLSFFSIVGTDDPAAVLSTNSTYADPVSLPTTGTYTLLVNPQGSGTGGGTLTLYDVPSDASGTIAATSSATTVTTTVPGQNGVLTFSGTAGQRLSLTIPSGNPTAAVTIRKPDGATLVSGQTGVFASLLEPPLLPVSGTYSILVDLHSFLTGTVTLTLHDVPADVSGTITPGGPSQTVTTTTPGQNGGLTFTGTASQRVSLSVGSGPGGTVSIRRANGTSLASRSITAIAGLIEPVTLPASETYSVFVDLNASNTGSVTVQLYDVPADVTGSITVNGAALGVTLTAPGQKAAVTFSGTSGQVVTVRMTGNAIGQTLVKLMKPDGTQLTSSSSSFGSFNLAAQTLPATGTYTIIVDPGGAATGSISISVTNP